MHAPASRDGGADAPACPPTLDTFDHQATTPEGWGVFNCGLREDGTPHVEIQRIDDPDDGSDPKFADDLETWKLVLGRAMEGSALHRTALGLVDPTERMVIESIHGWWPNDRQRAP